MGQAKIGWRLLQGSVRILANLVACRRPSIDMTRLTLADA